MFLYRKHAFAPLPSAALFRYFILGLCLPVLAGCAALRTQTEEQLSELILSDPPASLAFCVEHLHKVHGGGAYSAALDEEIAAYQSRVEESLVYREKTIAAAKYLEEKIQTGTPLSGRDLDRLNQGMVLHLGLRRELFQLAEAHECWMQIIPAHFGTGREGAANRLKGVMLSLSAALLLYDNYMLAVSSYENNHKLRRILNEDDAGYGLGEDELAAITQDYHSVRNRERTKRGVKFFDKQRAKISEDFKALDDFAYLRQLIEESPSYNITKSYSPLYAINAKLEVFGVITSDMLKKISVEGSNLFSKLFGNTVGLVETRKGRLYARNDVAETLRGKMRAGDILLEKTPFRLTDKFIPGHWGHAAIWVGTPAELKVLGIWEHPVVRRYHAEIEAGRGVVEALRPGVQMNPLAHFLNVDDLALIRDPKLDDTALAELIVLTLRQVGKEYDFNFDVETSDRIVCSELIYAAYTQTAWPTEKSLGRVTISPDNVASKVLETNGFELVVLFHDGRAVENEALETMRDLMGKSRITAGLGD